MYNEKTFNKFSINESSKFITTDGDSIYNIRFIKADKKENIWFSSNADYGGLYLYNGATFTHFTTKNGLTINNVWGILEDKGGNLWMGTNNIGLYRYDGKKLTSFQNK